ncbi:MAG: hypothetical protein M3N39_07770, partial [Pseudomonadota bacterium]|nr:hypothetical protein [Pseudomonadota bacterium]
MKLHFRNLQPGTGLLLATALLLGSCARTVIPPTSTSAPPTPVAEPPKPQTALEAGVRAGPELAALDPAAAQRAYQAFKISCPSLIKRTDASGLTTPDQWRPACEATNAIATNGAPELAADFFKRHFE